MSAGVSIRAATPADRDAIRTVEEAAFGRKDEALLVDALVAAGDAVLELVAETGGRIVGHILFSRLTVERPQGGFAAVALAPHAILPDGRPHAIRAALVEERKRIETVSRVTRRTVSLRPSRTPSAISSTRSVHIARHWPERSVLPGRSGCMRRPRRGDRHNSVFVRRRFPVGGDRQSCCGLLQHLVGCARNRLRTGCIGGIRSVSQRIVLGHGRMLRGASRRQRALAQVGLLPPLRVSRVSLLRRGPRGTAIALLRRPRPGSYAPGPGIVALVLGTALAARGADHDVPARGREVQVRRDLRELLVGFAHARSVDDARDESVAPMRHSGTLHRRSRSRTPAPRSGCDRPG